MLTRITKLMNAYTLKIMQGHMKGVEIPLEPGVTWLVGENGAGKSTILDALTTSRYVQLINSAGRNVNYAAIRWEKAKFDEKKSKAEDHREVKQFLKSLDQETIVETTGKPEVLRTKDDEGNKVETTKAVILELLRGNEFKYPMLSAGTDSLFGHFRWNARTGKRLPVEENKTINHAQAFILLWDEPELHLHPKQQRSIPDRLDDWLKKNGPMLKGPNGSTVPIFVIATTHSPFILAGIGKNKKHNVICLDDCKVVASSLSSQGYSNITTARQTANQLLGAGIKDIVPESFLVSERSVNYLLSTLTKKLDLPQFDFIIDTGGDGDTKKRLMTMSAISVLVRQVTGSWPEKEIYNFKIFCVADDEKKRKAFSEMFDDKFDNITIRSLGSQQLEDVFPIAWINDFIDASNYKSVHWDTNVKINDFIEDELGLTGQDIGFFKKELVDFVVAKIDSIPSLDTHLPSVADLLKEWECLQTKENANT